MIHNGAGTHEVDAWRRLKRGAAGSQTLMSGGSYCDQERIAGELEVNTTGHDRLLLPSTGERIEDGYARPVVAEDERNARGPNRQSSQRGPVPKLLFAPDEELKGSITFLEENALRAHLGR